MNEERWSISRPTLSALGLAPDVSKVAGADEFVPPQH